MVFTETNFSFVVKHDVRPKRHDNQEHDVKERTESRGYVLTTLCVNTLNFIKKNMPTIYV